jgi:Lrp/AsnC family transcriptional regulator for asnA, asnC and gidA
MTMEQVVELDATDERIIELLRSDGRMPYRAMAAEVGLTEATVRSRVRRLEESNAMRVVAVTDFQAAGYELMLAVGIQVDERDPLEVADALAMMPEVFSINLVIGTHDIEALVVARDQAALTKLVFHRLATLPGVLRVAPSLVVNVLKNQPDWVPLSDTTVPEPGASGGGNARPGEPGL